MAKEYSSRKSCYWDNDTVYIWVNNTDYLVKSLPDGTNTLISPIDNKIINKIYNIIDNFMVFEEQYQINSEFFILAMYNYYSMEQIEEDPNHLFHFDKEIFYTKYISNLDHLSKYGLVLPPNTHIMELYYSQINLCNRKVKQIIFMHYEYYYLEWRDWYFVNNSEIISDPLGDYDHTPISNFLINIY
jgi:hypothetical protein